MQDEQQYEQLLMQYRQLKNGAEDIAKMIENEDFDSAITLTKSREQLFLSCKCMRRYLELTPVQQKEIDNIVDEIKKIERSNIKKIEKEMESVQLELSKTQKTQKLHNAYDNTSMDSSGSMVNIEE